MRKDLSYIVGVYLDNAIEECEKNRKSNLMIEIYSKEEELRCTELAMKLGLSKMSVIRGCEQLKAMGLIDMEIRGRIGFVRSKYKGLELYKKAKPKLLKSIQSSISTVELV